MPSAFHGLSTMNSALRAFQRSLDVTGHNISNVNTPGYSRQTVDLVESIPTGFSGVTSFMLGNGVTIASVNRIQDAFLAGRRMTANSEGGRLDSMLGGLRSIESLTMEPGGPGIGNALDQFFNSWSALGSNPSEPSLRTQVQRDGSLLAGRIRGLHSDMTTQVAGMKGQITGMLGSIQQLTNSIAELNQTIRENSAVGATPNDLLDMRDQKLQELSGLVNLSVQRLPDGGVNVYMGSLTLVDQTGAKTVPTTYNAATAQLSDANGTYDVGGGSLYGLMEGIQKTTAYMSQLDSLANNLRTGVNSIHQTGTNSLGGTNLLFFNDAVPQTGAADFDLDAAVKADPNAIATGVTGNPGDGGLALSLSSLRDSAMPGLGGRTVKQFYSDLVGGIANDVSMGRAQQETQHAVGQQIDEQIQSISGVSLDDEMAKMLRFQRSYQAAAKALSVFDQTTEELIGLIR